MSRATQASVTERRHLGAAAARASLLVFYLTAAFGCSTTREVAAPLGKGADGAAAAARTLGHGSVIEDSIAGGEVHAFSLEMAEGNRIRVVIDKGDLGLSTTLCAEWGVECVEFGGRRYGKLDVPLTVRGVGAHRLELRALENDTVKRAYRLRVENDESAPESHERTAPAARLEAEAERLGARWEEAPLRESAEKYAEAGRLWESAGEPSRAAAAQGEAGNVYFTLSEYAPALNAFRQALRLGESATDARAAADALSGLSYVYIYLGENRKALNYAKRVLDIVKAGRPVAGDPWAARAEARALNNLGEVYYSLGQLHKSIDLFERALELWAEAGGDRRGEALAHLNIGYSRTDLGELLEAREHYQRSLSQWQSVDERRGVALAQTALGGVHSYFGEKQAALDLHREAVKLFRALSNRQGEAAALNGIATVFEDMNEHRAALDNYEQALKLYEDIGNRDFTALNRFYVGRVSFLLGDVTRALDYYRRSLSLSREVGNREIEAHGLNGIGVVFDAQGEKSEALHQFALVDALYQRLGNPRGRAYALNNLGHVYLSLGERRQALGCFRRALPLIRTASDRRGEALILLSNAQAERGGGSDAAALALVKESIKVIESLRSQVVSRELRTSYFASVHQHYEFYIDLLMSMDKERPGEGLAAEALLASERARARALMDSLAEERGGLPAGGALVRREQELQEGLNAKAEYQARLLAGRHTEAQAREVARDLRALTLEYQEVRARIREQSPRYAALTQPELLTVDSILREVREPDTLLLEYSLGAERSYLWVVDADDIRGHELPGRAVIEGAARQLYELLTARQALGGLPSTQRESAAREADEEYWRQAAALSRMLLGPASERLGEHRLLVVTEGFLQYIPFDALPHPDGADEPLLLSNEVVGLPSALVLTALRRETEPPAPLTIAVLADPVFDKDDPRCGARPAGAAAPEGTRDFYLSRAIKDTYGDAGLSDIPRLPSTRREARTVSSLLPASESLIATDFDASRERALSDGMGRYRIVHFATHAILNDEHPELSGIILSLVDERGSPRNGFLRLHDIYKLNLPAELVVLSACRTGLGRNVPGEGLIGLTRGFMYAGAKSVVASLWQVDDQATSELMGHFYRALLKEGMTPASALRAAKREMLKREDYRAPYFWAAFILQGEHRGRFARAEEGGPGYTRLVAVAAAALALSAAGVYLLRRARRNRIGL
jgi:CHAT domain-containing protein/Tfp pilus assembly protein PilF